MISVDVYSIQTVFQSFHKIVNPQDFYNCVLDLCSSIQTILCLILSIYVAACHEMGTIVVE